MSKLSAARKALRAIAKTECRQKLEENWDQILKVVKTARKALEDTK